MAILYSDVALRQLQGANFPGETPLLSGISVLPSVQNIPVREGPSEIVATYTWTGTEAAGDIIQWGIIPAGSQVDPWGHWQNGSVAPATTLTVSVGDNDQGTAAFNVGTGGLPIPNPTAVIAQPTGTTAPTFVGGTAYVPGNVVVSPTATPANATFTNYVATSSATAPESLTANWVANSTRYSTSINVAAAAAAVSFAPPIAAVGFNPYETLGDCWLQSRLLTLTAPVAGAISVIRVYINASN